VPGSFSKDKNRNYSASKAGNWFLASEFDKRTRADGIVCLAHSPGTLKTTAWDKAPWLMMAMLSPFMFEPKMGAYTELWAGLSTDVTSEDGGRFVLPWGTWQLSPKKELAASLKTREEGGTGLAREFWDWCEEHSKGYEGREI
jgi:NAD(P)-dependent dehydrogenase (short-subunit alcohol dehydrogenase family)